MSELSGKFPDLCDISGIVTTIINGCLTDKRDSSKIRMIKEMPEPILTDKSHTDMFMPIQAAPTVPFCIIQMDNFEAVDANMLIELQ